MDVGVFKGMIIPGDFRTERYAELNRIRWEHFLSMDLKLKGKTIFEPGAGVGDQTVWLLKQGVKHIYVNDGRAENVAIIRERYAADPRVAVLPAGNLEECLPYLDLKVDFIFCYGVYYHLNESMHDWPIMRGLSMLGDTIALDYLAGNDGNVYYGYDNPSTSLSQHALRPRTETLLKAMQKTWGYAYEPKTQLNWVDPLAAEQRLIAVGSKFPLVNEQLDQFCPDLVAV